MTQEELLQQIAKRLERMETEQKRQGEVQTKQGQAIDRIEGKLVLLTEDMSGFFHKTWQKMNEDRNETKKLEERIERVEEKSGITPHN